MKINESSNLKGNLKTLMATGGMLAGAGSSAQAAIVYTDISDLTVSAGSTIFFSLTGQAADTTGAVVEQFQLSFRYGMPQKPRLQGVANSGAFAGYNGPGYFFASRLTDGTPINSGLTFSSDGQLDNFGTGQWDPGTRGNIGLRFDSGGVKYGWADVSYNVGNSITLYDFAYEDSGGQILAAAPEPAATGALAAVFAGSLAAFEIRRRRKAARLFMAESEAAATI